MAKDNKDEVVLVTGGSRGIGRGIVLEFAREKKRIYFTYKKDESAASEVVSLANELGGAAYAVKCDSTHSESVAQTVEEIVQKEKAIDILVLNAGVTKDQYLMMMGEKEFETVIDTNLIGAFRFSKAVCRSMMARREGAIVAVASVAADFGIPGQTNYCASKGGLVAFTRAMAAEMAPKGVRVNAVLPGFIDTDMTAKMPRRVKSESKEKILLKRFGSIEEVARVVSFLASERASYIIGQAITVDGGLTSTVS